ncbi:MAG: glycosyltransferase family 39 protein [Acidobacteria bacterium]|nr:glycosyltransferase family 39 protein [Acidobacteriota bacterium]
MPANPEQSSFWRRHERAVLIAVILLGLTLRLYGVTLPLTDSHHQRQAQTAMVTRNLFENHMNIFYTQYDIYGNSPGYAILEFPLLNALVALMYTLFGVHEMIGRLATVAFSVGAMLLMHRLASRFFQPGPALAATAMYALSPMNIYFSRTFMPESPMMFFMVGAVCFFLEWIDRQRAGTYFAAILFAAFAFLVKIPTLFILVPVSYIYWDRYGMRGFRQAKFWVYSLGATAPAILWTLHASTVNSLSAEGWAPEADLVRFMGDFGVRFSFSYYSFLFRSAIFLLGPLGFLLLLAGVRMGKDQKSYRVLYVWLIAGLAYLFVLAGAASSHYYYILPLLPPAALFAGVWVQKTFHSEMAKIWLRRGSSRRSLFALVLLIALLIHGSFCIALARDLYDVKKRVPYHLEIAQIIRQKTIPSGALILNDPPNALNTTLTYYSHRKSWPFSVEPGDQAIRDLETLRAKGATTYVAVDNSYGSGVAETRRNGEFWRYLNDHYEPIALHTHYVIFDLLVPKRSKERPWSAMEAKGGSI